jgi:hypothetical protein
VKYPMHELRQRERNKVKLKTGKRRIKGASRNDVQK